MKEIRNATISSTMLGREDRWIFTYTIRVNYGGAGQSFGGYAMDVWDEKTKTRRGTRFGCEAIFKLLDVLEINEWEKLPGTPVRVESDFGKIYKIGHYLKEQWLDLSKLALECKDND